jgi:hypothetical protein
MTWRIRSRNGVLGYGHPTEENLRRFCQALEPSAGDSEILAAAALGKLTILRAKIVDDCTGETLVTYHRGENSAGS